MFAPPKEIETTVFSSIPDHLRMKNRKSGWSFGKGSDHLHSFIEGPSFDREGNLYVTDIPFGRVLKITPDKEWSVVTEYDGWPNGLKIHKDGRFFYCRSSPRDRAARSGKRQGHARSGPCAARRS